MPGILIATCVCRRVPVEHFGRNNFLACLPSSRRNSFVMHDLLNDPAASNEVCLPSSTSTLYNLETLILRGCQQLVELPSWINKLINLRYVDISGTWFLMKMPRGMGDLVKLEILPKFIVGADSGPTHKELKDLQFLLEELTIHSLHEVAEVGDARDSALNAKPGLTSLILIWALDEGPANTTDVTSQTQVLDCLQPHIKIKNLEIDGYREKQTLPSLGLLPLLKEVTVQGMDAGCADGSELYGNTMKSFPFLETLAFVDMYTWERWSFSTGSMQGNGPFPQLRELSLHNCPKLIIEGWPSQFPTLVNLAIVSCPLLETPIVIVSLPSLEDGHFGDCDGRILREEPPNDKQSYGTSLKALRIRHWSKVMSLPYGMTMTYNLLELEIQNCPSLTSFSGAKLPCSLRILEVQNCQKLQRLPEGIETAPRSNRDDYSSKSSNGGDSSAMRVSLLCFKS
ncbi:putative disease resistance RPP13-like protein 1 [Punica granatum]|uniref:Disease resistance RPP13-like protein 1 n=1 Tax=Punica granatum TaxID=22663 RepID=A0A6P8DQV7_PUNGR|nr:putative disease resistance RPP13-like protein 1 [Punica granatum]